MCKIDQTLFSTYSTRCLKSEGRLMGMQSVVFFWGQFFNVVKMAIIYKKI